MRVAYEEPPRRRLFETANVLADRGLPQTKATPGLGEASGLRYGHKAGQQSGVEHGLAVIMFRDYTNLGDRASQ
jgi:hypothetical protein